MKLRLLRVAAILALVLAIAATTVAALGVLGQPTFAASPAQRAPGVTVTVAVTPIPWLPTGRWETVHGPKLDPLWTSGATAAPSLRAVHGTWSGGKWIAWAVGDRGALAFYDGAQWQKKTDLEPAQQGGKTYNLRGVFIISSTLVWTVGEVEGQRNCDGCGFIMKYDGARWNELDPYSYRVISQVAPLNAIDMIQDEAGRWWGWIVGDDASFDVVKALIVRYTPELGWRLWTGPNNNAVNLNAVRIISSTEAWAVGTKGTEVWYTERHGAGDWPRLGLSGVDDRYAVDLADPLFGWDGGARGRMNYYYGQCHDGNDLTQCWFDNQGIPVLSQDGNLLNFDVYGIDLLSRREGWIVGKVNTNQSLVARLDMNRLKWIRVDVAADPARNLYALRMRDSRFGVAVGAEGVILEYHDDVPPSPTATPVPPTASSTSTPAPATPSPRPSTATPSPTHLPTTPPTATAAEPTPTRIGTLPAPTSSPRPASSVTATAPPSPTAGQGSGRIFVPLVAKRVTVKKR